MTTRALSDPVCWTFLVPDLPRPAGGLIAVYELANAMASTGRDVVRIVHMPSHEAQFRSEAEIPWFTFDPGVEHHFPLSLEPDGLPEADVVLYTVKSIAICLTPEAGTAGQRLIERLQDGGSPAGLPILFVQALGVFSADAELLALRGVGLKVCVASWIADNLIRAGLPATEVVHVPNGLDHDTFGLSRPIRGRPPLVAMNLNSHLLKNMDAGIEALNQLDRAVGVGAVLFGSQASPPDLGDRIQYVSTPSQMLLAQSIYRDASIYLQPSTQEGFGLCAIEAMACGCALVTTANGGSADYALDDETAVVCGSEPGEMAEALIRLVQDDERRITLATNGARYVKRFGWLTSAARLRAAAVEYLRDPERFRREPPSGLDDSVRVLQP